MHASRIKVNGGTLASAAQLDSVVASHPFVQQIDVVFPTTSAQLEQRFSALETTYHRTRCSLSNLFTHASHAHAHVSPMKAFPTRCDPDSDGAWCIDPRGVLTLCVPKSLYERLGLVGTRLPFERRHHFHAITIPLRQDTQSVKQHAKGCSALERWDVVWEVAHVGGGLQDTLRDSQTVDVKPQIRRYTDVFLPFPHLDPAPASEEDQEDWETRASALFEWVGMACLGAQRLAANDRVDPYVAVYEPPTPSRTGGMVHMRWSGLLDDAFVRAILAEASTTAQDDEAGSGSFVAVTMHANCLTPVSCLFPGDGKSAALRMPRSDGEDTVCVVIAGGRWLMAQSIGQWDTRWG